MQKKLVLGTILALVMVVSTSAQATSYSDAININYTDGSADGNVAVGTVGYANIGVVDQWNNFTGGAGGHQWSDYTDLSLNTATGTALTGMELMFYPDNTYSNLSTGYFTTLGGAANTLTHSGWQDVNQGWYGASTQVQMGSVPADFQAATYDVAALVVTSSGANWVLKLTDQTGATFGISTNSAPGSVYPGDWVGVAAIQVLKHGTATPAGVLTGSPVSGSDRDFGTVTAYSTGAGPLGATLSNTGPAGCTSITVGTPVITGADAAKFTSTGTGATLASGESTGYTFSFLGAATNGNYSATATIGTVTYNLKAAVSVSEWPGYLPGDFTEDGEVGPDDFGVLKDNFGRDGLASGNHDSWTLGDANDDGEIGPDDFGILKDNFGRDGGPVAPLTTAPEPATLALLALAGLAIRRKQR